MRQALQGQSVPWSSAWLGFSLTIPFLSDGRIVGTIQTNTPSLPTLPLAAPGSLPTSRLTELALLHQHESFETVKDLKSDEVGCRSFSSRRNHSRPFRECASGIGRIPREVCC